MYHLRGIFGWNKFSVKSQYVLSRILAKEIERGCTLTFLPQPRSQGLSSSRPLEQEREDGDGLKNYTSFRRM